MRRIMKVIESDPRTPSINRSVLQLANELVWNMSPLQGKDAWIETFLQRYSGLNDGGLWFLACYAIWILGEVLKTRILRDHEAEAYRTVIAGIQNGRDPEELATLATKLLGDCQMPCWGAVYACRRMDPEAAVHMLTTSISIVALAAGRTEFNALADRRPRMKEKRRELVQVEHSRISAARKSAERAFSDACRAKFLEMAGA